MFLESMAPSSSYIKSLLWTICLGLPSRCARFTDTVSHFLYRFFGSHFFDLFRRAYEDGPGLACRFTGSHFPLLEPIHAKVAQCQFSLFIVARHTKGAG